MTAAKRLNYIKTVCSDNGYNKLILTIDVLQQGTFGLYSAFLAWRAINFRSSGHPRLTVETMFLHQISGEYHRGSTLVVMSSTAVTH